MMKKVLLASTDLNIRLFRIRRSLAKNFLVSVLDPVVKAQNTKLLGRVPSAALRWPLYSLQILFAKSDILHFEDPPNFVVIPVISKHCKFVYDYRTTFYEKLAAEFPNSSLSTIARAVENRLANRADVIITANDIFAHKIWRLYKRRAYVVPNYPPKNFLPTKSRWEVRGDIAKPIVLFHGYLTYFIDFKNLLKCAKSIQDCEFWLIGDGPMKGWIKRHASPNVRLLGHVSHEEIPNYINACDVGIVPKKLPIKSALSNDQDLLKVGELASFCKPIVASGIAPSSQYLLVKPDELDKGIREALSGNVSIPVPHYWDDHSEKILFEAYSNF